MKKRLLAILSLTFSLLFPVSCGDLSSSVSETDENPSPTGYTSGDSSLSGSGEAESDSSYEESSSDSSSYSVDPASDPYENVDTDEFYENYTPASSLEDALYRSMHSLMSGSIESQDQKPDSLSYQPMSSSSYVRNSGSYYDEGGNSYRVCDACGDYAFTVYKGGGYVTLNEVAAYVYAFGDVPANYDEDTSANPRKSGWGRYLRLNHSYFTCNTEKYKYEPVLPDAYQSSTGEGNKLYYEMDIGTTGTDCDPSHAAAEYNDGYHITRGAARIVYTRYHSSGARIEDPDERYVFYTFNHYNDFQEYLNYEAGFGEMFGNVTGGGTLSSNTDCNPTPYVETVRENIYAF